LVDVSFYLKDERVPLGITRKISKDFPYARWRSTDSDLSFDFVRHAISPLPEKPRFTAITG
jgi:hypothetical protein